MNAEALIRDISVLTHAASVCVQLMEIEPETFKWQARTNLHNVVLYAMGDTIELALRELWQTVQHANA